MGLCVGKNPQEDLADKYTVPTHSHSDPPPFPTRGTNVDGIEDFLKRCGGRNALKGMNTTEVCNKHLKPMTESRQESYVDLLEREFPPGQKSGTRVGKGDVFIIHCWRYNFVDVMDTIIHHVKTTFPDTWPEVIVWFDLFSNNQHLTPNLTFEWWATTFRTAIQNFGHVVLVLSPWSNPIPFTRAWCLWEIYCAVDTNSRFEVALSDEDRKSFIDSGPDDFMNMLGTIDVNKSESWDPKDREKIFEAIHRTTTAGDINAAVLKLMREWTMKMREDEHALHDGEGGSDEEAAIRRKDTLASLKYNQGLLDDAERLVVEVLEWMRRNKGDRHPDTLNTLNNLGILYSNKGDYAAAEKMYKEALAGRRKVLGMDHPHTKQAARNLRNVYDATNRASEARSLKKTFKL
eukprot:GFYU01007891.1.p1 GENE.GFYU01007891.1~~GFYU01007891.1.p1  ORF type:complete len:404 (-),score=111.10 GFYU01007891.1:375-1586(-)